MLASVSRLHCYGTIVLFHSSTYVLSVGSHTSSKEALASFAAYHTEMIPRRFVSADDTWRETELRAWGRSSRIFWLRFFTHGIFRHFLRQFALYLTLTDHGTKCRRGNTPQNVHLLILYYGSRVQMVTFKPSQRRHYRGSKLECVPHIRYVRTRHNVILAIIIIGYQLQRDKVIRKRKVNSARPHCML